MESEKLKEAVVFKQIDFKKNGKKRKRLKFAILFLGLFSFIIIISVISKINFSLFFDWQSSARKMVKPLADSSFEEKILKGLKKVNLTSKRISFLNEKDVEVVLTDDLKVLLTRSKDLQFSLTSLQLILERFRIEGRRLKKIDLRFKNPIIYPNNSSRARGGLIWVCIPQLSSALGGLEYGEYRIIVYAKR